MSLAQAIQLLRRVNAEGNVAKHAAAQPGLDAAAAVGGPPKGPGRSQDHGRLPEATLEAAQATPRPTATSAVEVLGGVGCPGMVASE